MHEFCRNSIITDFKFIFRFVYCYFLSLRVLKAVDAGFPTKWNDIVSEKRPHCYYVADSLLSGRLSDGNPSLSMGHLTGPFVILLVGYALAIWTFILEKIIQLILIRCNVAGRQVDLVAL